MTKGIKEMIGETERWNLILETIGQLGKLNDLKIMKRDIPTTK
ncbi:MAG: hypothetical protein WCF14_12205 [Nitrososphaeraceae archaeon]